MLLGVSSSLDYSTMTIAKKAVQALIEMCAGNYLNQEAALKGLVTNSIKNILSFEKIVPTLKGKVLVSAMYFFVHVSTIYVEIFEAKMG